MKRLLFIIALFVVPAFALEIQNLRVVPKNIDAGNLTRIMFKLSGPAKLSINVKGLNGASVTSLISNVLYPAGQFSIPWKSPEKIASGYYIPVITAVDQTSGESVTKQIETRTAKMISLPVTTSDLPGGNKKISYSIDKAALVSIRVGINNGPMYKIISNWELTQPGPYSVKWDGWDGDHVIKVDQLANYLIDIKYIPVGIDALYVTNPKNISKKTIVPASEILRQINAFVPKYSVAVSNKKITSENNESIDLNINVDDKTLEELGDIPYEYVLYIDGKRYGEIENTTSPYTWKILTKNLDEGSHIFTLMICTSIEQINTRSFKLTL